MFPWRASAAALIGAALTVSIAGCGGDAAHIGMNFGPSVGSTSASTSGPPALAYDPDSAILRARYAQLAEAIQRGDVPALADLLSRAFSRGGLDHASAIGGLAQMFRDHAAHHETVSAAFEIRVLQVDAAAGSATATGTALLAPKRIRPTFSIRQLFFSEASPDYWRREQDGVWRLYGDESGSRPADRVGS